MVQLVEGLPRLPLTYLSNGPGCLGQACQSPLVIYNYCCPAVGYGLEASFLPRPDRGKWSHTRKLLVEVLQECQVLWAVYEVVVLRRFWPRDDLARIHRAIGQTNRAVRREVEDW